VPPEKAFLEDPFGEYFLLFCPIFTIFGWNFDVFMGFCLKRLKHYANIEKWHNLEVGLFCATNDGLDGI
jgi:hypothetical protein